MYSLQAFKIILQFLSTQKCHNSYVPADVFLDRQVDHLPLQLHSVCVPLHDFWFHAVTCNTIVETRDNHQDIPINLEIIGSGLLSMLPLCILHKIPHLTRICSENNRSLTFFFANIATLFQFDVTK